MVAKAPLFPFEGLHVYQRIQQAWTAGLELARADPLWGKFEVEIQAALGIARATARSRSNGGFADELERARGSVHAAAAIVEQLSRRGSPVGEDLRGHLAFVSRALGALVRSLHPGGTIGPSSDQNVDAPCAP